MQNTNRELPNEGKDRIDSAYVPKQERSAKTYAAIIAAAREMVIEDGTKSLTITDVAARAGLTTGAIYARFRNKDALIEALIRDVMATDRQKMEEFIALMEERQATPKEMVIEAITLSLSAIREYNAIFGRLAADFMRAEELRQYFVKMLEESIRITQAFFLKRRDEIPHPKPELAGAMVVALLQGMTDWALLFSESPEPIVQITEEELIEEMARAVLGYLGYGSMENEQTKEEK